MRNRMLSNGDWILWLVMVVVWIGSFVYDGTPLNDTVWCVWRRFVGLNCFGCGLTRSFMAVSDGHILRSLALHPVGPFLYGAMVWRIVVTLLRTGSGNVALLRLPSRLVVGYWMLVSVVFCAHAVKVIMGWASS